jgi:hypothetical protein
MVCDTDGGQGGGGIQNQKQEPHTKMWGKTTSPLARATTITKKIL